ncbi:MAG: hypothetical protein JSS99_05705 [Actinobacteria bacterium]|nr:hypothetical protein [Actinomycetota bacterium]
MPSPLLVAAAVAVLLAAAAARAGAVVGAAVTLDGGPGSGADIVSLDGVAMAEDGSGGLVYSKRVGGHVHVFVSRFAERAWQPPQRVDVGQPYDSSWPAIGAGDGGRLVVTWIHQFGAGVQNRMYSASLDPGATRFQAPVAIDLDVREGLDAAPSLSMSPGGAAYLVYRVVYARQSPSLPPGTVDADIRIQRYSGSFWSLLGQPVDRIVSQPQATPTPLNGPRVATDQAGDAVVAWQEPDDQLIPRVYARRVFGKVLGNVLQASPSDVGGTPLDAPADQLSLAVSPFGEAIVGLRQQGDAKTAWTRPRALVNMLPSSFADGAGTFVGARPVDGGGANGPDPAGGALGTVSVSTDDDGGFDAGVGLGARVLDVGGDEVSVADPVRLDAGGGTTASDPLVARGQEGTLAAAWSVGDGVGLFERDADGTPFDRTVSADAGGALQTLRLGGSSLGSALVGFLQGRDAGKQIAAAAIEVPPGRFTVLTPPGWTRRRRLRLTWDAAPSTNGPLTYAVQVDGADVVDGVRGLARTLGRGQLDDGRHRVTVVATDADGQTRTSVGSALLVDRTPPRVRVTALGGGRVRVTVRDGVSGVAGVRIAWGDGRRGRGRRATHAYAHAGRHVVNVIARDRAGNVRRLRRAVVA